MEGCGGQNQVLPTSGIKQKKVAEKTASRQERERGINTVGFKVQIANIKEPEIRNQENGPGIWQLGCW